MFVVLSLPFVLVYNFYMIYFFQWQGYVVCPSEKRFLLLFTFLKKNRKKKVMVFFSSCKSVKYHHELLNYIDLPVSCIHVSKCYYLQILNEVDKSVVLHILHLCCDNLIEIRLLLDTCMGSCDMKCHISTDQSVIMRYSIQT